MANLYKISLIFAFIVLAACTDYGDVVDEKYEELIASQQVVDTLACDLKSEGMEVPTADGGKRKCVGGEWIPVVEEYISSSSENEHSSSSVTKSSTSIAPPTDKPASSSVVNSNNATSSSSEVNDSFSSSNIADLSSSSRVPESSSSSTILESSSDEVLESSSSSSSIIPIQSSSSQNLNLTGSVYDAMTNTLTDLRDNHVYKTVTIDGQIWMAENLNHIYNHGSAKSYCFENDYKKCDKYGRLYTWSAAMDSAVVYSSSGFGCGYGIYCGSSTLGHVRGVCPEGWALPDSADWEKLVSFVGKSPSAGYNLKSKTGWIPFSGKDFNGGDTYGFNAIPAGEMGTNGAFDNEGYFALFWSSSESSSLDRNVNSYCFILASHNQSALIEPVNRKNGLSVRCLKMD